VSAKIGKETSSEEEEIDGIVGLFFEGLFEEGDTSGEDLAFLFLPSPS
jgi:hypothetical protein